MVSRRSISDSQIIFFLISGFVSYHLMDLPKDMVQYCNTGGWASLLVIALLSLLYVKGLMYLISCHENQIITDYMDKLIGSRFALIISASFGVFYFFYTCKKVRVCSEIIKYTILPETSPNITMILIVFIIFYGLNKGFSTITRLSEVFGIITIVIFIGLNLIFATKVDISNIRPFFVASDFPIYIKGVTKIYNRFLGLDILLLIPISLKFNKNIKKKLYKVIAFLLVSYIFVCEISIGIIGLYDIGNYDGVFFITSRIISLDRLDFLRRLDSFLYFAFFLKIFISILIYSYVSITYLKYATQRLLRKLFVFFDRNSILIFCILCYIVSFATDNLKEASYYLNFLSYVLLFFTTIIPIYIIYVQWCKKNIFN